MLEQHYAHLLSQIEELNEISREGNRWFELYFTYDRHNDLMHLTINRIGGIREDEEQRFLEESLLWQLYEIGYFLNRLPGFGTNVLTKLEIINCFILTDLDLSQLHGYKFESLSLIGNRISDVGDLSNHRYLVELKILTQHDINLNNILNINSLRRIECNHEEFHFPVFY